MKTQSGILGAEALQKVGHLLCMWHQPSSIHGIPYGPLSIEPVVTPDMSERTPTKQNKAKLNIFQN